MQRRRSRGLRGMPVSALEFLETRILPAVTVSFNAGSGRLTLKGNGASDSVSLEGTGVVGNVHAYVNGVYNNTFVGVQSLVANLKGGNDTLNLSSFVISGDVTIKMGSGGDIFDVDNVTDFSPGPDTAMSFGGDLNVKMGSNPGDLIRFDVSAGDFIQVHGNASFIGAADVNLDGDGGSFLVEGDDIHFFDNLKIDFSPWGDVDGDLNNLTMDDVNVSNATTIICSVADDRIEIGDSAFGEEVTVQLSFGNNLFDVDLAGDANDFQGLLMLRGVFGIDTYDASGANQFAFAPVLIGIEMVI